MSTIRKIEYIHGEYPSQKKVDGKVEYRTKFARYEDERNRFFVRIPMQFDITKSTKWKDKIHEVRMYHLFREQMTMTLRYPTQP